MTPRLHNECCPVHSQPLVKQEAPVARGYVLACPLKSCQYSVMPRSGVCVHGEPPQAHIAAPTTPRAKQPSGNKYRNEKTELDGVVFDSAKEAKRWALLTLMERAGEITNLQRQVRYDFLINGVKCGYYKADFVYEQNGTTVVEDTKSAVTAKLPMYRLKKKLMLALYGVNIQEV